MRLTDKDELIATIKKTNCKQCKSKGKDYYGIQCRTCPIENEIEDIDEAPTVDAVPVVRCKDCEYWRDDDKWCSVTARYNLLGEEIDLEENEFCSYGVRRDTIS